MAVKIHRNLLLCIYTITFEWTTKKSLYKSGRTADLPHSVSEIGSIEGSEFHSATAFSKSIRIGTYFCCCCRKIFWSKSGHNYIEVCEFNLSCIMDIEHLTVYVHWLFVEWIDEYIQISAWRLNYTRSVVAFFFRDRIWKDFCD